MGKVIVFDIWADYAHFKKPYTTTSPITYSIPSRTTITGIIGAMIGIPKNENNEVLNCNNANITVAIKNPIKKQMMAHNLIDTKKAKYKDNRVRISNRTQIRFEYLRDVNYRIYIEIIDEKMHNQLKEMLEQHKTYYTISLGLSENIANYKYIGEYEYIFDEGNVEIDSVINLKKILCNQINHELDKEYFVDRFSIEMKNNREVTNYSDVIFERNAKKISVSNMKYIKLQNDEKIIFL